MWLLDRGCIRGWGGVCRDALENDVGGGAGMYRRHHLALGCVRPRSRKAKRVCWWKGPRHGPTTRGRPWTTTRVRRPGPGRPGLQCRPRRPRRPSRLGRPRRCRLGRPSPRPNPRGEYNGMCSEHLRGVLEYFPPPPLCCGAPLSALLTLVIERQMAHVNGADNKSRVRGPSICDLYSLSFFPPSSREQEHRL